MMSRTLAVVTTLVGLAGAVLVATPAAAAPTSGELLIRGPGTLYAGPDAQVSQATGAGATDAFDLRVVNTGGTLAQYNVKMFVGASRAQATVGLYAGTLALTSLAVGPDGYTTVPIQPGRSQALAVKVAFAKGSPQGTVDVSVELSAPDGTVLDDAVAIAEVKAPARGTDANDIFARQGYQPWIGGPGVGQTAGSPATKVGATAKFSVRVQNDSAAPAQVGVHMTPFAPCLTIKVLDGTTDVTGEVLGSAYSTPVLPAGGTRTLTVLATHTGTVDCLGSDFVSVTSFPGNLHTLDLLVPFPPE